MPPTRGARYEIRVVRFKRHESAVRRDDRPLAALCASCAGTAVRCDRNQRCLWRAIGNNPKAIPALVNLRKAARGARIQIRRHGIERHELATRRHRRVWARTSTWHRGTRVVHGMLDRELVHIDDQEALWGRSATRSSGIRDRNWYGLRSGNR